MWQFIGDFLREAGNVIFTQENVQQLKDFAVDHAEQNIEAVKEIAEKAKELLK